MKYILLAVVALVGCGKPGTKFNIGDCVDIKPKRKVIDPWTRPKPHLEKIIAIGKESYRTRTVDHETESYMMFDWEQFYEKRPCQ